MKRFLLLSLLLVVPVMAEPVLIFNPATGRILAYLTSQNTPMWQGVSNALINPVTPPGIPIFLLTQFAKVTNGVVVEFSQAEKDAIAAADAAALDASVRQGAKAPVSDFNAMGLELRAFASVSLDEINTLRQELNEAKTNLAAWRAAPTLNPRTLLQLKTAITNKINLGSVDQ